VERELPFRPNAEGAPYWLEGALPNLLEPEAVSYCVEREAPLRPPNLAELEGTPPLRPKEDPPNLLEAEGTPYCEEGELTPNLLEAEGEPYLEEGELPPNLADAEEEIVSSPNLPEAEGDPPNPFEADGAPY
jgi:hypothetical protein